MLNSWQPTLPVRCKYLCQHGWPAVLHAGQTSVEFDTCCEITLFPCYKVLAIKLKPHNSEKRSSTRAVFGKKTFSRAFSSDPTSSFPPTSPGQRERPDERPTRVCQSSVHLYNLRLRGELRFCAHSHIRKGNAPIRLRLKSIRAHATLFYRTKLALQIHEEFWGFLMNSWAGMGDGSRFSSK